MIPRIVERTVLDVDDSLIDVQIETPNEISYDVQVALLLFRADIVHITGHAMVEDDIESPRTIADVDVISRR